ncbi:uncharacterized protein LOC5512453 [Nematostella vectensis]|uniref:uncharacterized protein LOC5512453 n=1 Tax=Nematostella vectensis TaxID=45351 RepID=UPI0020777DE9|nr:uncharacterized protein LOC5512453 [Nematostella vectensis]
MGDHTSEKLRVENVRLKHQQNELSSDLNEEKEMVKYLHGVIKNYEVLLKRGSKQRDINIPVIASSGSFTSEEAVVYGSEQREKIGLQIGLGMEKVKRKGKEKKEKAGFLRQMREKAFKKKFVSGDTTQRNAKDSERDQTSEVELSMHEKTKGSQLDCHLRQQNESPFVGSSRTSTPIRDFVPGSYFRGRPSGRLENNPAKTESKECRVTVPYPLIDDDLFLCDSHGTKGDETTPSHAPFRKLNFGNYGPDRVYYGRYANRQSPANHSAKFFSIPYKDIVTDVMEEVAEIPEVSDIDRNSSMKVNVMDLIESSWEQMEQACDTEEGDLSDITDGELAQSCNATTSQNKSHANISRNNGNAAQLPSDTDSASSGSKSREEDTTLSRDFGNATPSHEVRDFAVETPSDSVSNAMNPAQAHDICSKPEKQKNSRKTRKNLKEEKYEKPRDLSRNETITKVHDVKEKSHETKTLHEKSSKSNNAFILNDQQCSKDGTIASSNSDPQTDTVTNETGNCTELKQKLSHNKSSNPRVKGDNANAVEASKKQPFDKNHNIRHLSDIKNNAELQSRNINFHRMSRNDSIGSSISNSSNRANNPPQKRKLRDKRNHADEFLARNMGNASRSASDMSQSSPCLSEFEDFSSYNESDSDASLTGDALVQMSWILDRMMSKLKRTKDSLEISDTTLSRMERRVEYLESFAFGEESECL